MKPSQKVLETKQPSWLKLIFQLITEVIRAYREYSRKGK